MALGRNNQSDGSKAISIKYRLKDTQNQFLDVGEFAIQEKGADDKYMDVSAARREELTGSKTPLYDVTGDLVKLEPRKGEYEGDPVYSFKLALKDVARNETYYVDVGLGSGVGKSVANTILNLTAFNEVNLGSYGQKNKETKKIYPAVAVRQGGKQETVKWKYDPKGTELPAPREFEGKGGKTEKDWTKVEEFFFAKLTEFAKVVEAAAKSGSVGAPKAASAPAPKPATVPAEQQSDDDSSVPF